MVEYAANANSGEEVLRLAQQRLESLQSPEWQTGAAQEQWGSASDVQDYDNAADPLPDSG